LFQSISFFVESAGDVVNFQVSVLKILSGYPNGLASKVDVKRDLALLATSGPDWARYSRRLAAQFPSLDVFSAGMVQIHSFGWRLTIKGSIVLEMMVQAARNAADDAYAAPSASVVAEVERLEAAVQNVVLATEQLPLERPLDRRALFTVIEGGRSEAA
jgi:hypothetical protein